MQRIAVEIAGGPVEAVERKIVGKGGGGIGAAAELAQDDDLEVAPLEVVGFGAECLIEMGEGGGPIAVLAVDLCEREEGRGSPCSVPCCFVEGGVGLIAVALKPQGAAEVIEGFAVGGVGVAR